MCHIYNNSSGYHEPAETRHLQVNILYNGAYVCPVSSIAVLFIKEKVFVSLI